MFLKNPGKEIQILQTGRELFDKTREAYNTGSVFELGDVFNELARRYSN